MTYKTPTGHEIAVALQRADCTSRDGTYVHAPTKDVVATVQKLLRATLGELTASSEVKR